VAGSPQYATLVAATPTSLTFDQDFQAVTIINRSATDDVYARIGATDPAVATTGSYLVPARCVRRLPVHTAGATVVRLISAGTPSVEVAGVVDG
jgi:hypothetical protein